MALKVGALLDLGPGMFVSLMLRPMPCESGAAEFLLDEGSWACKPKGRAFSARASCASSETWISPEPLSAVRNSERLIIPSRSVSIASKSTSVTDPRAAEALDILEGRGDAGGSGGDDITPGAQDTEWATECRMGDSEFGRPDGAGRERRGEVALCCWNRGGSCSTAGGGPAGPGDSGAASDGLRTATEDLDDTGETQTSTLPAKSCGPAHGAGTEPLCTAYGGRTQFTPMFAGSVFRETSLGPGELQRALPGSGDSARSATIVGRPPG